MILEVTSEQEMKELGARIGAALRGGDVLQFVGDIGAGKTTLVKGIAVGLEIDDDVQSPSFTISRVYDARDGLRFAHYDFYRLNDAGILRDELREFEQDESTIIAIEWADIIDDVLPSDAHRVIIAAMSEATRTVTIDDALAERFA